MSLNQKSELCKRGEDQEDPRENQDLLEEQLFGAEEEEAISSSSQSVLFPDNPEEVAAAVAPSPPQIPQGVCPSPSAMEAVPCSRSEVEGSSSRDEEGPSSREGSVAQSSLQDIICVKTSDLVNFLLLKFRAKEPTTKAEMLSIVIGEHADHFPEIFRCATDCLQLIYGVDVNEVDPVNNAYVLGTVLDLTYDGSSESGIPKTGLLVMVLCAIAMEGGCAPEHKVWEALNNVGVHDGMEHYMFGDPRELITKVLVEEQYLEYRQVTDSDPARYEFLWGPRAHAETTNLKILEFLSRVKIRNASSIPSLS